MSKTIIKILALLFLISALGAGLVLVRQRQETRRGAAGSQVKAWFLPSSAENKKVGDQLPVSLVIDLGTKKLAALAIRIKFPPDYLSVNSDQIKINSLLETVLLKEIDPQIGSIYLAAVDTDGNAPSGLLTINDPVVKIPFQILKAGEAKVYLDKSYAESELLSEGGEELILTNQDGGDEIAVVYQISSSAPVSPIPTEAQETPTPVSPTPTLPPSADTPIINFKVSFAGVTNSQTVQEMPKVSLKIKRGFDLVAEFNQIALEPDQGSLFKGRVVLTGVKPGDNYTIYLKGPRHLARKFCQDQQKERCLGPGSISLKAGENNFDFSQLSLEPGDLPNPTENMTQDGRVDGNDFSLLKLRLGQTTAEELAVADLDFNQVINGRDIVLFLQTLSSKYGEEE